jgi:hypothetical protein
MSKVRNALLLTAATAVRWLPTSAAAETTVQATLMEQNNSGASGSVELLGSAVLAASVSATDLRKRPGGR